jgi:3'(2'), 5'-bisphosphate nucleotidase
VVVLQNDNESLAEELVPVAQAAGRAILRHFAGKAAPTWKADRTPVTQADTEAEAIILEALARLYPDVPVVAEEQAAAGLTPHIAQRFFLVDPLDGTRAFLQGSRDFTVNIGLVDGDQPVFGLIYAPAHGDLFVTTGPQIAVHLPLQRCDMPADLHHAVPLSARKPQDTALVGLTSHSSYSDAIRDFMKDRGIAETIIMGSSLKFCTLARGLADIYPRFGPTSEWDTAAGQAILEAAGGSVRCHDGRPLRYGKVNAGFVNPGFIAVGREPVCA